jgi:hypothetical protein
MDAKVDSHHPMAAEPGRLRHLLLKNRRHLIFKMTGPPPAPAGHITNDNVLYH